MDANDLGELIQRAQNRDADAFDALVEAYSPRLYGYFYRLTRSRDDAEDLLQDTFVRVVRRIGNYEHDGRFDGWIFRIGTNLVRDRVRRIKASRAVDTNDDLLADQPDNAAATPNEQLETSEQIDRLQSAIDELPEHEREVILLRHFSDMSFRDIAETVGMPLGTALARAHRGLKRLRQIMDGNTE